MARDGWAEKSATRKGLTSKLAFSWLAMTSSKIQLMTFLTKLLHNVDIPILKYLSLPDQSLSELDNFYQNDPERKWYTSFQHWCGQNGVRYFPTEFLMRATNVTMTVNQLY